MKKTERKKACPVLMPSSSSASDSEATKVSGTMKALKPMKVRIELRNSGSPSR